MGFINVSMKIVFFDKSEVIHGYLIFKQLPIKQRISSDFKYYCPILTLTAVFSQIRLVFTVG